MIKQAFILAGGKGERLNCLTKPKPMYKVGSQPIVGSLINSLLESEVNDIIVSVGYLKEILIEYVKKEHTHSSITVIESASTIKKSILKAKEHLAENFFILCADIFTDLNFRDFNVAYDLKEKPFMMASVKRQNTKTYGLIKGDEKNGYSFIPNSKNLGESGSVDSGLWIGSHKFLQEVEKHDDYYEAVASMFKKDQADIYEHKDGYWFDIGTQKRYEQACRFAEENLIK